MGYGLLADLVVGVHVAFAFFALLGGLLVLQWRRWAWFHIPAGGWAVFIEFSGRMCPLTPLENWLREKAGGPGYGSGFVEHYILPVLYPSVLTRGDQMALGILVVTINVAIYGWVIYRKLKGKRLTQWTPSK
jgi:hypothetical protein